MGTDGKYVVTYEIFIVTACSVKTNNRTVRHRSSSSRNSVLVQELVSRYSSRWDFHFHSYVLTIYVCLY